MSKRSYDSSSGSGNPAKRTKASQACASCRKHKTRCELLDGLSASNGSLTCHRCKVLNIQCSFESSNIIHLPPSQTRPEASRVLVNNPTSLPTPIPSSASPSDSSSFCPPLIPTTIPHQLPSPSPSSSDHSSPQNHREPSVKTTRANSVRELSPEDLLEGSACRDGFDWTAAPILAIQELASKNNPYPPMPQKVHSKGDRDLHSVLSRDQITRLLEIFDERYAPWLCLSTRRSSSPLLDLVRCTVAASHLDAVTRASVSPRLQKLTETLFLNKISEINPESIEALLILSLWSPLNSAGYGVKRDSKAFASSAVNIAMNMGLSEASVLRAQALRASEIQPPPDLADLTGKARLWLLVTATESMACVGTGRMPVSRPSETDLKFIDPTTIKNDESARDVRLGFISKMLEVVENGFKVRLYSPENFEEFYIASQSKIRMTACIHSFIKPLPIVSQYEQFFFDMTLLQFHGWSLLLSHHFLRELRTVMDGHDGQPWMLARYKGIAIPMIYGHEANTSAQNVLTIFTSKCDTALLSAAPDHVFCLVTFAAAWIIISNFAMHQLNGVNLGWANEKLISLVAEKLSHIAHSPEHLPARCAHMIMRLVHMWETRHAPRPSTTVRPEEKWGIFASKERRAYAARFVPQILSAERSTAEPHQDYQQPLPLSPPEEQRREEEPMMQQPQPRHPASSDPNLSILSGIGVAQEWTDANDLLMDSSFWSTFMENLNAEVPGFNVGLPV